MSSKISPKITSTDIDIKRVPLSEFYKMKDSFPGHNDEDLIRFLLAKDGVYSLAYDLYRKHLDWLENNPKPTKDTIINTLSRHWTYAHGYDREGHPILVARIARHSKDFRDIQEVTREQLWWLDHVMTFLLLSSLRLLSHFSYSCWLECQKINRSLHSLSIEQMPLRSIKTSISWNISQEYSR
jgi:hypothetical protein